jgi:hypothetical protein
MNPPRRTVLLGMNEMIIRHNIRDIFNRALWAAAWHAQQTRVK